METKIETLIISDLKAIIQFYSTENSIALYHTFFYNTYFF